MNTTQLLDYPYYDCHSGQERIARQRRTKLFVEVTCLTPTKLDLNSNLVVVQLAAIQGHIDHVSIFISPMNTVMVLAEQYGVKSIRASIVSPEFALIEVPEPLAPYCGQWSDKSGARSGTSSYLLCLSKHHAELNCINQKLRTAEKIAPAWNWIGGSK